MGAGWADLRNSRDRELNNQFLSYLLRQRNAGKMTPEQYETERDRYTPGADGMRATVKDALIHPSLMRLRPGARVYAPPPRLMEPGTYERQYFQTLANNYNKTGSNNATSLERLEIARAMAEEAAQGPPQAYRSYGENTYENYNKRNNPEKFSLEDLGLNSPSSNALTKAHESMRRTLKYTPWALSEEQKQYIKSLPSNSTSTTPSNPTSTTPS